jgi:metallo-beta-lactamase class B
MVYADSVTAVAADGFRYTDTPALLAAFEKTFAAIAALPCDILVTPHPEASDLFGRLEKRNAGATDAMIDREACRRYAQAGLKRFRTRLASEKTGAR